MRVGTWLVLLVLPLVGGCASTRIAQETWTTYEANAPLEVASVSTLSVVVAPFVDERYVHGQEPGRELGGWHRWRMLRHQEDSQLKQLFARWLVKDLTASGAFPGARFAPWSGLLDAEPKPDLVVTAVIRSDEARAHWLVGSRAATMTLALPLSPLLLFGVPVGWVDFDLELEVQVYAFDDLSRPLWTKTVHAEDSRISNWAQPFGDLLDTYLFTHNQAVRPLYAQVVSELAADLEAGGVFHAPGE